MPPEGPESAIVIRVRVPPALDRLRRRWDRAAGAGVPAHVTVLYPFLPPTQLDPAVRGALAGIAASHLPFDVAFGEVGRFPGVVFLVPDPKHPFIRLTEAIAARFPDFPPYGGAFDEIVPHLTVAESSDAPLDEIAIRAQAALPFHARSTALEVLVDDTSGRWRPFWRVRLGVRP